MEPVLVGHGFTFRPPYRVNVLLWVMADTSMSPAVDVIEQLRSLVEARDYFGGVLRPPSLRHSHRGPIELPDRLFSRN